MNAKSVEQLAEWLRASERTVVLTGAGVSTDSGIPDFRSAESGLWVDHDPMEVASIEGFSNDPERFYRFWRSRFAALERARPNLTHRMLAALEARGLLHAVITQNIDGLHQKAGSRRVFEVHGNWARSRCLTCGRADSTLALLEGQTGPLRAPGCNVCGGLMKPDVVLFGEPLTGDFERAQAAVSSSRLLIALGTSLGVQPVSGLIDRALDCEARVALINREATGRDGDADLVLHADLRDAMLALARQFEIDLGPSR